MMVPAFGDVAFNLRKDRLRLAPYDPRKSPYGWHILKRLR
jgi:parvulin-like peptidyl-prolyl isomerase